MVDNIDYYNQETGHIKLPIMIEYKLDSTNIAKVIPKTFYINKDNKITSNKLNAKGYGAATKEVKEVIPSFVELPKPKKGQSITIDKTTYVSMEDVSNNKDLKNIY